ncbi:hypothetical protein Pan97_30090 [Bremerella volcania]|uniref:Uncharacterized protein n=1 Tax=Bremerella volcania TaxID=2527984 RepID=A0A518C9R3_9BACT|nr:hypothetical protein [Bremerella volcania]QDU75965.1 hypothetical protein Pan97_30090 [Bremerella volcania]
MPKTLYAVTAIKSGLPVGAFIIADNPDDCVSRASRRLGTRDRITHLIPMCEATLGTMKRNGLLKYVNEDGKIEFLADAILEIIDSLQDNIATLQKALAVHVGMLTEKLKLQRFKFSATDQDGHVQFHETYAPDFASAMRAADELCMKEYGSRPFFFQRVSDASE